jgi:AsmA protein
MKRTWVIVVGALVALAGAAVALGFFAISHFDVKKLIEKTAYEQTGRALTIKGVVRPVLFPTLGVHAGVVALANAPGGDAPSLLTADEVQIGIAVDALMRRELNVTELVFVKPRLALELDAAGKPNWLLAPVAPRKPSASGGPISDLKEVRLKGARVESGMVSYFNARTSKRMGVQDINAILSLPSLDGPLGVDGAASFNGQKLDLAAKLAKPRTALAGGTSPLAFSFKSAPVNAAFDGELNARTGGLVGLLEVGGPSLRTFAAWLGASLGEGPTLQDFHVAGRFTLGPKSADFANASLKLDAIRGRGDFLIETARAKPAISGRLELTELDLNPYLGGPAPAASSANATPVARIESVDVAKTTGWSRSAIDLSGLKAVDANLDLTTGPLTTQKLKLDGAKLDVVVHDGYLAATLREVALYGGAGTGRMEIDARAPDLIVRHELDVSGLDAAAFLAAAAGFDRLEGKSALKLNLVSRGRDQQSLVSGTDGAISLAIEDGALRGINLRGVSRTIRTAMSGDMVGPKARTPFKTFTANFIVSDGVGATDDLRIRAAGAEITAAGVIDLGGRSMDVRIRPKSASVLSEIGIAPGAGIAAPFRISGPWRKLEYKLDLLGGARDTIAQQVKIVRTRARMSRNAPK